MPATTTNINDSFFDSSYKYDWKKIIPPGLTEAEVDFIIEVASLHPGDHVLDLMCGYGRHAIELASRDIKVKALYIPFYFLFMNISVFMGFNRFIRNKQTVLWERAARQKQV